MSISICMLVKNESINLKKNLLPYVQYFDEIIIADTGSIDDTPSICANIADDFITINVFNSFSDARNILISKATCEWILVLDADEIMVESDLEALRRISSTSQEMAFRLPRYNYIGEGMWSLSNNIRFFRNGNGFHFQRNIHETIRPSLGAYKAYQMKQHIHHFPASNSLKNTHYLSWLLESYEAEKNPLLLDKIASEYFALGEYDKAFEAMDILLSTDYPIPRFFSNLGFMHIHLKQWEVAQEQLGIARDMIVRATGGDDRVSLDTIYTGLGRIAYLKGDYESALQLALEITHSSPDLAHPYVNAYMCYRRMGNLQEAKDYWALGTKRNPLLLSDNIYFPHVEHKTSIYAINNMLYHPIARESAS